MTEKGKHYVNNREFYNLIVEYNNAMKHANETGAAEPRIPERIGEMIIKIANRIGTRYNFSGYTYIEDMIGAGILDAVLAVPKFNPEKSNNPFGYFTLIIMRAFIRYIEKEKKQTAVREKMMFDLNSIHHVEGENKVIIDQTELYQWYHQ